MILPSSLTKPFSAEWRRCHNVCCLILGPAVEDIVIPAQDQEAHTKDDVIEIGVFPCITWMSFSNFSQIAWSTYLNL